ncbi:MAG: hypothetical protein KDE09_24165 [Anaerolineales bacterium]|nr:hypothetical protein [Anaerolineales bacterium]
MQKTEIPDETQNIISAEYAKAQSDEYFLYLLPVTTRIQILASLGPSNQLPAEERTDPVRKAHVSQLTLADRVRTRLAILTAQKVLPLWPDACAESDRLVGTDDAQLELAYQQVRAALPIEQISVYDVPRLSLPSHILALTEHFLADKISDFSQFCRQANELWQLYPRPELHEHAFFIKWAAQDALYEALGWLDYNCHEPYQHAEYAYAGIFWGESSAERRAIFDPVRRTEFWSWWLGEALPAAWQTG